MSTKVKVCGIRNVEDAVFCVEHGVDFVGMIFAESPRRATVSQAKSIAREVKGQIPIVAVFDQFDRAEVTRLLNEVQFDFLQTYYRPGNTNMGNPPLPLFSSVWIEDSDFAVPPYPCDYLLLDFKKVGGPQGLSLDKWSRVAENHDVFLAGGIGPDNAAELIETYKPFGIDCARGTEVEPGVKDHGKIQRLMEIVKSCSR